MGTGTSRRPGASAWPRLKIYNRRRGQAEAPGRLDVRVSLPLASVSVVRPSVERARRARAVCYFNRNERQAKGVGRRLSTPLLAALTALL